MDWRSCWAWSSHRNVYKFSDTNLGLYYNFETELNSLNKIGLGARFQGNWLKASDFVDHLHLELTKLTAIH